MAQGVVGTWAGFPFKGTRSSRDHRTPLDELALTLDDSAYGQGLKRIVVDQRQIARKVSNNLVHGQATKINNADASTPQK